VLIIVSRNIDLSVGSLLGFLGYVMAVVQAHWIPETFGFGFDRPFTWVVAPSEPSGPPPSSWKVESSGEIVLPCSPMRKMRPRHTRKPPRVTMKAGTPP